MSLPGAYRDHLKNAIGAQHVWLPGSPFQAGDFFLDGGDVWRHGGSLTDFGVQVNITAHQSRSLDLKTKSAKELLMKGNVATTLPELEADQEASASVEFKLEKRFDFVIKTPTLTVKSVTNLVQVARKLKDHPDWDRDDFFVAYEVQEAGEFTYVGSRSSNQSVKFEGSSGALVKLLKFGASAGLTRSGSADVALTGSGGAVAMGLCRIKKDGSIDFA